MNDPITCDVERRLLLAVEQYKRRVAEAARLLREEVDAYSAEMTRQMAADPHNIQVESRSWVQ